MLGKVLSKKHNSKMSPNLGGNSNIAHVLQAGINSNKNSKKNFSSKLQSKGVGKTKMTGIRKVGRGN